MSDAQSDTRSALPVDPEGPGRSGPASTGPGLLRRLWSRKAVRFLIAAIGVACLAVLALSLLTGTVNTQQEDHPRSNTGTGSAAIAQLLRDEGVDLETVSTIEDAVARSDETTTLVVARPENLTEQSGRELLTSQRARLVVVKPDQGALNALHLAAKTSAPGEDTASANCSDPIATRAASLRLHATKGVYRPTTGQQEGDGCFRSGNGFAYLPMDATGGTADLLAGGLDNDSLDEEGNAAFAMGLLGTQPKIIWLMTPQSEQPGASAPQGPSLLPDWWLIAVVQALVAVTVLAIWRGRRLGPILTEQLPVTVRASETVEGHGRLYERLQARDRAGAALRRRAHTRLAASFGHAEDPEALAAVVANRTGRDLGQVRFLLSGPVPADDDQLIDLALHLDQLEQEARQP